MSEHPEQAEEIRARLADMEEVWEELCGTMKKREEGLGEASKLQGFLRHLDDFQAWLSRTQTAVASEDTPTSLAEAEQLLAQHDAIKNEVDNYRDDYERIKATGAEVRSNTFVTHKVLKYTACPFTMVWFCVCVGDPGPDGRSAHVPGAAAAGSGHGLAGSASDVGEQTVPAGPGLRLPDLPQRRQAGRELPQ